jgi:hypothetical protein
MHDGVLHSMSCHGSLKLYCSLSPTSRELDETEWTVSDAIEQAVRVALIRDDGVAPEHEARCLLVYM